MDGVQASFILVMKTTNATANCFRLIPGRETLVFPFPLFPFLLSHRIISAGYQEAEKQPHIWRSPFQFSPVLYYEVRDLAVVSVKLGEKTRSRGLMVLAPRGRTEMYHIDR